MSNYHSGVGGSASISAGSTLPFGSNATAVPSVFSVLSHSSGVQPPLFPSSTLGTTATEAFAALGYTLHTGAPSYANYSPVAPRKSALMSGPTNSLQPSFPQGSGLSALTMPS